ncbi:MAG: hypothetical protein WCD76_20110 [Pyrinomonadaceae bacterium]
MTGMRQCELLALTEAVIDFRRDLLYVLNPKWRKDKRKTEGLPFSAEARTLIIDYAGWPLFTRGDGQRITGPMVNSFSGGGEARGPRRASLPRPAAPLRHSLRRGES